MSDSLAKAQNKKIKDNSSLSPLVVLPPAKKGNTFSSSNRHHSNRHQEAHKDHTIRNEIVTSSDNTIIIVANQLNVTYPIDLGAEGIRGFLKIDI